MNTQHKTSESCNDDEVELHFLIVKVDLLDREVSNVDPLRPDEHAEIWATLEIALSLYTERGRCHQVG